MKMFSTALVCALVAMGGMSIAQADTGGGQANLQIDTFHGGGWDRGGHGGGWGHGHGGGWDRGGGWGRGHGGGWDRGGGWGRGHGGGWDRGGGWGRGHGHRDCYYNPYRPYCR